MNTKFVRKVTITGVDLYTNRRRLDTLQRTFPYVEWGVLLSKNKEGKDNRYPPRTWVNETLSGRLNLAGHLCGIWARDVAEGGQMFVQERLDWLPMLQRMQLNISHILADIHPATKLYDGIDLIHQAAPELRVIIQARPPLDACVAPILHKVDVLFDCSGGCGILPEKWQPPAYGGKLISNCGYAGGLSPDNLAENLAQIEIAREGQPIWIDVESGVRTSEVLDLDKVERFLEIASPYVIND